VRKFCCSVCLSSNVGFGLQEFSSNVSLVCNVCNFRDIVFCGDSRSEAIIFWKSVVARRRLPIARRSRLVSAMLPSVWFSESYESEGRDWVFLVALPKVFQRVARRFCFVIPSVATNFKVAPLD